MLRPEREAGTAGRGGQCRVAQRQRAGNSVQVQAARQGGACLSEAGGGQPQPAGAASPRSSTLIIPPAPDGHCAKRHGHDAKCQRPAAPVRVADVTKQQGADGACRHGQAKDEPMVQNGWAGGGGGGAWVTHMYAHMHMGLPGACATAAAAGGRRLEQRTSHQ